MPPDTSARRLTAAIAELVAELRLDREGRRAAHDEALTAIRGLEGAIDSLSSNVHTLEESIAFETFSRPDPAPTAHQPVRPEETAHHA